MKPSSRRRVGSDLNKSLTHDALVGLAGERYFKRGEGYRRGEGRRDRSVSIGRVSNQTSRQSLRFTRDSSLSAFVNES